MTLRAVLVALCMAPVMLSGPTVLAQSIPPCSSGLEGATCYSVADCGAAGEMACVDDRCRYTCMSLAGAAEPSHCSLGETCVAGGGDLSTTYYCQPTPFSMDLNLLDMCLTYFADGISPVLSRVDACSLERRLNRLLDQTGDGRFNVFDADGCIRAYFYRPRCGSSGQESCDPGQTFCTADDACGHGLFCDTTRNSCQRECGFIASREPNAPAALERECHGDLKVCNYNRGRCETTDVSALSCQIDADCPSGAYCFVGRCAPQCSRSLDCPDSTWYCTTDNRCEPVPKPAGDAGFVFDPQAYVTRFIERNVSLSALEDSRALGLVIMDLDSKREVFSNPAVSFGYRLEVTGYKKLAPKCQKPLQDLSETDRADCTIVPEEEFITLLSPFGTLYADEQPLIPIMLNQHAYDQLTPGSYQASLTAIFSNGASDSITLGLRKTTVSGTYVGQLSIYVLDADQHLGNTNLSIDIDVATDQPMIGWNELLARENIRQDFYETTQGYEVQGYLDGNSSAVFNLPAATSRKENKIPVRGLYSPAMGRLRLIAIIDVAAEHCVADSGNCADVPLPGAWERLVVPNVFGRHVRRQIELIGPFDATLRQFHGMYRETVTGLAPFSITLSGGFQLRQVAASDQGIDLTDPLIPDTCPDMVCPDVLCSDGTCPDANGLCSDGLCADIVFPAAQALSDVEADIAARCADFTDASAKLADRLAFDSYLEGIQCPAAGCGALEGRILDDLMEFGSNVQALVSNATNSSTALTIYDSLREQNVFCKPEDPGGAAPICVDEDKLLCGMALYRKAVLSGWVSMTGIDGGDHQLFCTGAAASEPDCLQAGTDAATLVTLQELGRFYQPLAQVKKFEAGAELSDALYVLFRAHDDPLVRAEAMAVKDAALHTAWANYEDLRQAIFSNPSSAILYRWPMWAFRGRGAEWLAQMHNVLRERRDLLESMIDLKRRVFAATSEQDFLFVQHLFHEEYLTQVFLIWLQREWQGEGFLYEGTGPEMLERAQMILMRVNETRNPLGFHADRVFFENNNLQLSNWERYKAVLGTPNDFGLVRQVQDAVLEAVNELRASLASQAALTSRINETTAQFLQTIDSICGPKLPLGSGACETRVQTDITAMEHVCEDDACSQVMRVFDGAVSNIADVACRADRTLYTVKVDGADRPCVRGQMGILLQEKAQLELQRRSVIPRLRALLRQVDAQSFHIAETQREHLSLVEYLEDYNDDMQDVEDDIRTAEAIYQGAMVGVDAMKCNILVGTASGGNCLQKAAAAIVQTEALLARDAVMDEYADERAQFNEARDVRLREDSHNANLRAQRVHLYTLQAGVENLIAEYEMVTLQLFNLMMRLDDTHFLAAEAAKQYKVRLNDIVTNLIGNEPAGVLRRNAKAREAEEKFLRSLQVAYKMAMAFSHRYNLRDQAGELVAKVFRLMTPNDISKFIDELDAYERSYCATTGIDCDAQHNLAYLRFSMRDELFPTLTDIVDAQTGKVLTRGEQFHNLLTSSMFRRKRKLGSQLIDQIEVPFSIWLNDRRGQSGVVKPFMLSPLECNHAIAGEGQGTMAVNVIGTRLTDNIQYELWRGNTDFIRACEPKETVPIEGGTTVIEYPIHKFLVGYAPESPLGQQDTPPRFVTHTGAEVACRNVLEGNLGYVTDESCYNYFARDRSLAAPDWKLVIPLDGSGLGNEWLLGDGLAKDERPIVEDIVIYVRHRKRPIVH